MGVYYKAVIVVGLPGPELREIEEDFEYEDLGLSLYSSYDAPCDEGIVGLSVKSSPDYFWTKLSDEDITNRIEDRLKEFKTITGKDGEVFLVTHGY